MKEDPFSIYDEPQYQDSSFKEEENYSPAKEKPDDEFLAMHSSVWNEPGNESQFNTFPQWFHDNQKRCTSLGNKLSILGAGVCGGLFAIFGALIIDMVAPPGSNFFVFAVAIFGPVLEEILKQSGMIYLLEKKPFRITSVRQIYFCALIAAFIFGSIENLIYTYIYFPPSETENWEVFRTYRWLVCMPAHVFWTQISSLGLVRAWRNMKAQGRPFELQESYNFFVIAMVLHGAYNFIVMLLPENILGF